MSISFERQFKRTASVILAAGMLAAGIAMLFAGQSDTPARAASLYTIEIIDSGFNPTTCVVNRNDDEVRWFNKTSKVVRVYVPDVGGPDNPPRYDFEVQPGQYSTTKLRVSHNVELDYYDKNIPAHSGRIVAPFENNAAPNCSPAAPTPTPTNTPTRTPTPTATPSNTPFAVPPRCVGTPGCAVVVDIVKEE